MMNVAGTERTRLFVEGVSTAITAEVRGRRDDGLVVTQALPFLRIDTPVVAEGGTRARIARVAISMEGDVPRLLLELAHEDAPLVEARAERATLLEAGAERAMLVETGAIESPTPFTPGVSTRPPRRDSTIPYDFAPDAHAARVVTVTEASARCDEPTVAAPRAEPTVAAPHAQLSRAPRERWWSWLVGRITALLAHWTRRSLPALPPS